MPTNPDDIGKPALISIDCRVGSPAQGKVGTYLGDMPTGIVVALKEGDYRDINYSQCALEMLERLSVPTLTDHAEQVLAALGESLESMQRRPQWYKRWIQKPYMAGMKDLEAQEDYWYFNSNPLIAVGNFEGEVDYIWGAECWWRFLKEGEVPPATQAALEAEATAVGVGAIHCRPVLQP